MKSKPKHLTKDLIIDDLRRVYDQNGSISRSIYRSKGRFASSSIETHFDSWCNALVEAGLADPEPVVRAPLYDEEEEELERDLDRKWTRERKEILDRHERKELQSVKQYLHNKYNLLEAFDEAIERLPPLSVKVVPRELPKRSPAKKHITLWFEFSDLQLGTYIISEEIGGLNTHDWSIWQRKCEMWIQGVIERIERYAMSYNIDKVIIANLGDMVEGQDIFPGQKWQIDRNVVDQVLEGGSETGAAFAKIIGSFPSLKFDILEVFGNHGRVGKKGESPHACSMDRLFQRIVARELRTTGLENYVYNYNEAYFFLAGVYGFNHLLIHGDQGVAGLWSGGRPTGAALQKAVHSYSSLLKAPINFMHLGHFHTDWALSFNDGYILINGSFIGTNNFSAAQLVAGSPPMQLMHVFDPDHGLVASERILLDVNQHHRRGVSPRVLVSGD